MTDVMQDLEELAEDQFSSFGLSTIQFTHSSHYFQPVTVNNNSFSPFPPTQQSQSFAPSNNFNFAQPTWNSTPVPQTQQAFPSWQSFSSDHQQFGTRDARGLSPSREPEEEAQQFCRHSPKMDFSSTTSIPATTPKPEQDKAKEWLQQYIHLSHVDVFDYNGLEQIEHSQRVQHPKILLLDQYFGIEYEDSFKGTSLVALLPADILCLVRQSDKFAVYFKFRKTLSHCGKVIKDKFGIIEQESSEDVNMLEETQKTFIPHIKEYYKESPFHSCMNMLIYFYKLEDITKLFFNLEKSDFVLHQLRIVYPGYMLCHQSVTQQDLVAFTTGIQHTTTAETTYRPYVRAKSSLLSMEETGQSPSSASDVVEELTQKVSTLELSNTTSPSSAEKTTFPVVWVPKQSAAALDTSKYELVLPANFTALDNELREYVMYLMKEKNLMPYQLTVVLCRVLALATTEKSKTRAKKVLLTLSNYPGVQLTNMDKVARYITLGEMIETQQEKSPSTAVVVAENQERSKSKSVVVHQTNQVFPTSSAAGPLTVNTASTSPKPKAIRHERSFSAGNEISPQLVDYYYEKEKSYRDVMIEDDWVLVTTPHKLSLQGSTTKQPKFARSSPTPCSGNNSNNQIIPSPVNSRKYNSFENTSESVQVEPCIHVIHHHHHYYHNVTDRNSSKSDASDASENSTTPVLQKQPEKQVPSDTKKQVKGKKQSTKSVQGSEEDVREEEEDVGYKFGILSCWTALFKRLKQSTRSSRCSREDIELQ